MTNIAYNTVVPFYITSKRASIIIEIGLNLKYEINMIKIVGDTVLRYLMNMQDLRMN